MTTDPALAERAAIVRFVLEVAEINKVADPNCVGALEELAWAIEEGQHIPKQETKEQP